ncbi:MAG: GH3 auxin-responsive promoter family protein [Firmicutes bacterium]|nr:GH3 auxin-responsive promoter family protein [Bacillota bacterium]
MLSKLIYRYAVFKGTKVLVRFNKTALKPMEYNLKTLFQVLEENKDTEYGRKHNFSAIRTAEDFRSQVPYSNYDTYVPYIEKMKHGERNFIAKKPPVYFASTTGTTMQRKAIPVSAKTRKMFGRFGSTFGFAIINRQLKNLWKKGKILNIMEMKTTDFPCGVKYGPVSGMLIKTVKRYFPYTTTTPSKCVFTNYVFDNSYVHLRFALVYRKLSGISSAFMSSVTGLFWYLKDNWETLVDDIDKGTINKKIDMPDEVRRSLMKKIKPDPIRAAELRKEFEKGFDGDVFKRVWPDLAFIYAIGSGAFVPHVEKAKIFTGGVPMYFSFFAASESLMAVCTEMDTLRYALLPESAFYEFIPIENCGDENPMSLTLDQVKLGEEYEIVLTNTSGFYRYRIGDVVKIVGMYGNTPEIRFSYRLSQEINIVNEKMNDSHIQWAVGQCEEAFGCNILEYSVFPQIEPLPGKYVIFIEGDNEKLRPILRPLRNMLEEKLSVAHPRFGGYIKSGVLAPIELKLVKEQTFALYREFMIKNGTSANQIKPVRIIDTPEKEKFFFERVEEKEENADE